MDLVIALLLCALGYLSGSVLYAPLICRLINAPPPHLYGSRNPGATNVYRIAGPWPAVLVLTADALKAWIPVTLAQVLDASPTTQAAVGLFAIAGHMLPLFSDFQGGKGVASTLGAGLALAATTILISALIWLLLFRRYRVASLASVISALLAPLISLWFNPEQFTLFVILMLFLLIRHRDNLVRLRQHREHSF